MATEVSAARSNYFGCSNRERFTAWCGELSLELIEDGDLVGFLAPDGLPSQATVLAGAQASIERPLEGVFDTWEPINGEPGGTTYEIDLADELATFLIPGHVAVVTGFYRSKMNYCGGFAFAINSEGEMKRVDTNEITAIAVDLGSKVTTATD